MTARTGGKGAVRVSLRDVASILDRSLWAQNPRHPDLERDGPHRNIGAIVQRTGQTPRRAERELADIDLWGIDAGMRAR